MSGRRRRFWVETACSVGCGLLALLTLVWRDWIEVTGVDPDHHDGSAEWLVVVVLGLIAVACALVAWAEARRPLVASGS